MLKEPKVIIALSIYKPNIKWFNELLNSLNEQTYENIELLIWNDCPEDSFDYEVFIKERIYNFPFLYKKAEINLGANKAFENLTYLAQGDYIAYCDQDDIWLSDKLKKMVNYLQIRERDLVACCLKVIDSESRETNKFIKPRLLPSKKIDMFETLLMHAWVNGCAMLVKLDMAKRALPFPNVKSAYYDWWISLYVSTYGKIGMLDDCLIKYRVYGNNTSTVIYINKEDYYNNRLLEFNNKIKAVKERFLCREQQEIINNVINYSISRINYFRNHTLINAYRLFENRRFNKKAVYYELLQPLIPSKIFVYFINRYMSSRLIEISIKELLK